MSKWTVKRARNEEIAKLEAELNQSQATLAAIIDLIQSVTPSRAIESLEDTIREITTPAKICPNCNDSGVYLANRDGSYNEIECRFCKGKDTLAEDESLNKQAERIAELEAERDRYKQALQILHHHDYTNDARDYLLGKDSVEYAVLTVLVHELNEPPSEDDS